MRAVISGVGYTPITANSGTSVLRLAVEASRNAMADAGLDRADIGGVYTFGLNDTVQSVEVAMELRLHDANWTVDVVGGGNSAAATVAQAAAIVEAGLARHVLVFRAMNGRSGIRLGGVGQDIETGGTRQFLASAGMLTYPQQMAMWCRRHIELSGTDPEAYAQIAIRSREYASENPRAQKQELITVDDYFDSPMIVDPFRLLDICLESDAACALIVSAADTVADLRSRPVHILGANHGGYAPQGASLEDFLSYPDISKNFAGAVVPPLLSSLGMTLADIDVAEIYDCFTHTVMLTAEGMGLFPKGEGADYFTQPDAMRLTSDLPINTHGGLLSEGYLMGLSHVLEGVLQVRGECGARQVDGAETALVTSGAMMQGSALVLGREAA